MSDVVLSEGLYVRRSKGQFGGGATSRESVMESLYFPCKVENGYVELYPVMDDLNRVLRILEKVPVDHFKEEYTLKDDSRDIYLKLKETVS